jgi:hypothetical protein
MGGVERAGIHTCIQPARCDCSETEDGEAEGEGAKWREGDWTRGERRKGKVIDSIGTGYPLLNALLYTETGSYSTGV